MASFNDTLSDGLVPIYTNYFYSQPDNSDLRFNLLKNYVCNYILNILYNRFIKEGEVEPIQSIPEEKKIKYWNLACMYQKSNLDRIKAAKSAYTLELITSTF